MLKVRERSRAAGDVSEFHLVGIKRRGSGDYVPYISTSSSESMAIGNDCFAPMSALISIAIPCSEQVVVAVVVDTKEAWMF